LARSKQVRPVREIRTLGAMWRGLETDSRFGFQGTSVRKAVRYAAFQGTSVRKAVRYAAFGTMGTSS
jgi:hypothetical protein